MELLALERGGDEQAERRDGDEAADHGAEAERRGLEELAPREAVADGLAGAVDRRRRRPPRQQAAEAGGSASVAWRERSRDPEEAEDERDRAADRDRRPADDQANEDADDADGESDRPQRRGRKVRLIVPVPGLHLVTPPFAYRAGFNPSFLLPVNDVTRWRNDPYAYRLRLSPRADADAVFRPAAVDQRLDLGGHLDLRRPFTRALLGQLVRRVDADLPADELALRRVVEVVDRPLREQDVALRVDVRA